MGATVCCVVCLIAIGQAEGRVPDPTTLKSDARLRTHPPRAVAPGDEHRPGSARPTTYYYRPPEPYSLRDQGKNAYLRVPNGWDSSAKSWQAPPSKRRPLTAGDRIVVVSPVADVKRGTYVLGWARPGERFVVRQAQGNWIGVDLNARTRGWIHHSQVRYESAANGGGWGR